MMADLPALAHTGAFGAPKTKFTTSSWDVRQSFGRRAQLLESAREVLAERGRELAGEPAAPPRVFVQTRGTAILARMRYPATERRFVLKPASLNEGERDARELARVLTALAATSSRIARGLAPVVDFDYDRNMLILEHVPGDQLSTHLQRELRGVVTGEGKCHALLEKAARFLADVQQLSAPCLLPGRPMRDHRSFARAFTSHALNLTSSFRRAGFDGPEGLLESLSAGFFTRTGDRVSIADARPKNIIVRPDASVAFIDLDCSPAPPALGVGLFLVALDRLASRYPCFGVQRRLWSWKRTFVQAYFAQADAAAAEDLAFFYPWSVVQMLRQHSAQRPAMRPYLTWHYGRTLERFLTRLRERPSFAAGHDPADLFDAPSHATTARAIPAPRVIL